MATSTNFIYVENDQFVDTVTTTTIANSGGYTTDNTTVSWENTSGGWVQPNVEKYEYFDGYYEKQSGLPIVGATPQQTAREILLAKELERVQDELRALQEKHAAVEVLDDSDERELAL